MNQLFPLSKGLDHPAYHEPVKLRGYNGKVSALRALVPQDAARVLRVTNPDWTQQDHKALALQHQAESDRLSELHGALLDEAHLATFGVPRQIFDYRISAIGREEYPDEMKARLRLAAHGATYHSRLHHAHHAAGRRASRRCTQAERAA